jgi:uncharacterized protein YqgC (DUF456 family)
LASWVDSQIGSSRPASPGKRLAHALVGVVAVQASVGVLYGVQAAGASQAGLMAAVLGLFLPALVYAMLAGLWMVRLLAELAGHASR